jgi:PhnB protein
MVTATTAGRACPAGRNVTDSARADPQVIPYLLYEDAATALDWLAITFGFTARARRARPDGSVRHAELALDGGGVVMLGSPGPDYRSPARLGGATQLIRVTVTDLQAHRDRAQAAGADVSPVDCGPPGWLSYTVTDPEGHVWYFTQPPAGRPAGR